MVGEDMPQLANRVDLDPDLRERLRASRCRASPLRAPLRDRVLRDFGPPARRRLPRRRRRARLVRPPVGTLTEATGWAARLPDPPPRRTSWARRAWRRPGHVGGGRLRARARIRHLYVADGSVFVSSSGSTRPSPSWRSRSAWPPPGGRLSAQRSPSPRRNAEEPVPTRRMLPGTVADAFVEPGRRAPSARRLPRASAIPHFRLFVWAGHLAWSATGCRAWRRAGSS